ncbi:hypothetical protein EJ110_NYTH22222 [Nymphaea thermarum]|nr:hypothetical protein EJ110_NYTH22222 [Nymphaea thermarum]
MRPIIFIEDEDASVSMALFINNDLPVEILLRLPVKALLKFRSVCKEWRRLIDSQDFENFSRKSYTISYNPDRYRVETVEFRVGNGLSYGASMVSVGFGCESFTWTLDTDKCNIEDFLAGHRAGPPPGTRHAKAINVFFPGIRGDFAGS